MNIYYATMKSPIYYTRLDTFYQYLGHLCVSLGFAFVLSLTIEAPFMNLTKLILQGNKPQYLNKNGLFVIVITQANRIRVLKIQRTPMSSSFKLNTCEIHFIKVREACMNVIGCLCTEIGACIFCVIFSFTTSFV